ncbi:MAG: peptidase domain-containing ABC transporter [Saprospiraceae bacterium]|nr:peptidase domain-containing ABC transporter [Saprospiraceae bacterium]
MPVLFPFYRQRDAMDCGPACLMMIAAAHGRRFTLPYLREQSYLSREGVSALGIVEAAEGVGFRTMTVKVPFDSGKSTACLLEAPLPCIAHWNQNHFVVVYRANERYVWVADPGAGKFKIARPDFEKSWCSDAGKGILILLEPTPEFYRIEAAVPQSTTRWSQVLDYLKPHRQLMVQLLVGMTLGSVLQLIFPFLTQSIVDFGIENRNLGFIYIILAAQLMLFFSQMVVQFVQSRILLFIGTRINVAMVNDFLAKLMRLPIGFFDTKMTGDLMQRIGDQSRIESFLTQSSLAVLFSAVNFLIFSLVLFVYNRTIFALFCFAAVLYVVWILFFLRRRKEIDYIRFQQSGENSNTLIELIQGMQEIKLQGSERKRRWIWAGIQAKLFHTNLQSLNLAQWQETGAGFINQGKNILISFLAASAVIDGQMTLGMMLATIYMVGQLDAPLQQFIAFIRAAQDAKISLERLSEVRDQPDEDAAAAHKFTRMGDTETPTARLVPSIVLPAGGHQFRQVSMPEHADFHLDQVSFRYNHLADDVLDKVSLTIPHGKVTAIVGTSGSGKTTLVKLLLGFYQPTKGVIRLGNTALHHIQPSIWRKQCGAVMQDGFIFSDSIANNIAESDEYPDREKLLHAVTLANIRDFVEELPLGYNTLIGSRGNGVSQGQRQRLLIARAVYKNPKFLFFDEATNALDANNERVIVENLQQFYQKKTVVVVAHRLSTVRHADQIIVLEKGGVVEIGTHEELVGQRNAYFNLVRNQLELGA